MSREEMLRIFPERGGDPDREGKKDPLDCVVWRGERPGEPAWDSPFGRGRPGWHIECSAIALDLLGATFDVQGGGSDLVFPHHEMCANEAQVATGQRFAQVYAHAGMVAYDGEKMSKSRGNLVFVSAAAPQRRRPDGDPAEPAAPPLPQRLGVGRRRALGLRRHPGASGGAPSRCTPARPRPRSWTRCSPRSPTTSTPPAPAPPSTPGCTPPSVATAWPTSAIPVRPMRSRLSSTLRSASSEARVGASAGRRRAESAHLQANRRHMSRLDV